MGLMDKYNKGGVKFDVDIAGFSFVNLESLYARDNGNTVFGIDGLYINKKSSFGDHPVAIVASESILVDLPGFMTDDVKEILRDSEVVEAIRAGKVGFSVQQYESKNFKRICYGIKWEDMD